MHSNASIGTRPAGTEVVDSRQLAPLRHGVDAHSSKSICHTIRVAEMSGKATTILLVRDTIMIARAIAPRSCRRPSLGHKRSCRRRRPRRRSGRPRRSCRLSRYRPPSSATSSRCEDQCVQPLYRRVCSAAVRLRAHLARVGLTLVDVGGAVGALVAGGAGAEVAVDRQGIGGERDAPNLRHAVAAVPAQRRA